MKPKKKSAEGGKKMKNKPRLLYPLCDHMADIMESQPHILSAKFTDDNEEEKVINVMSNDMFKSYFEYFFYSYCMITFRVLTDNEIVNRFNDMWRLFQVEEKPNLDKIVKAYYWDYVPVYNYDRTEKWTDIRTGSEDDDKGKKESNTKTTGSYKDETTPEGVTIQTKDTSGGYVDTDTQDEDAITHQVTTMDNPNWRNKEKEIYDENVNTLRREYEDLEEKTVTEYDEAKTTTERTFNNYNVQVKDDAYTDTHTYNEVTDTHEGRMFGNIGTTTSMQMINEEFEGRIHELAYEWLKKFFDKYFIMM